MTMVPAHTLSKQQLHHNHLAGGYEDYGGCGSSYNNTESVGLMSRLEGYEYCVNSEACLGSDLLANNPMAEDESRTDSLNEAGSSSKDAQEDRDEGWLQLSIGGRSTTTTATTTATAGHDSKLGHEYHQQVDPIARRGGLVELDLLPGSSSLQPRPLMSSPIFHVPEFRAPPRPVMNIAGATSFSTSLFYHQQHTAASSSTYLPPPPPPPPPHHHHHHHHHNHQQQEISWTFRPMASYNMAAAPSSSSSSSSSSLMPFGSYFPRPIQVHSGLEVAAGPSLDFRVIDPPRRPHSGIWFMLQASQNQAKEPFLPQIAKSYLRIKDGGMTVRLLMKYLVNKFRLDSESEIEITCRGQQLLPYLTLQHVRDNIWSPRDAVTLLPDSSTTDHIMVLHYGRSAA